MINAKAVANEKIAHVHAAIEHQGPNRQYTMLQTRDEYEGKAFTLLIDSGATHSFISPTCVRKLILPVLTKSKLSVQLATGQYAQSVTSIGELKFKLGGYQTIASFWVLPMGVFDGILGMDWLAKHNATIECKAKLLRFITQLGEEVTIPGIGGDPKLQLVTTTKLLKAYCKKKMVYAIKLNPLESPKPSNEPTWLAEYVDVFLEELTQLPLPSDVDHAIDLIPQAQPIAKRPYKMSLPEAIELKQQLT